MSEIYIQSRWHSYISPLSCHLYTIHVVLLLAAVKGSARHVQRTSVQRNSFSDVDSWARAAVVQMPFQNI